MVKKCLLAAAILATMIACPNPLTNIAKPTGASTRMITVSWHVAGSQARTLYPQTYPTPSTYDVTLQPGNLSKTGLTTNSWTFDNLQAVVYTITVTGKDSGGNAIVTGSGSADLTSVAVQNPSIVLSYISTGSGTGKIDLTFDAGTSGVTVSSTEFTLVDPAGALVVDRVSLSGSSPTFSYTNTSAVVGTYKMFAKFTGSGMTALKADTIIVVQGVDTAVTVPLTAIDFTASYVAVTGLSLADMTLTLGGPAQSLVPTFTPPNPSNTWVRGWSSGNWNVATVDQNGLVSAVAVGQAVITAVSVDNPAVQANCTVTVKGTVAYDANGGSGSVPVDGNTYTLNQTVTVQDNSGSPPLTNSGWTFAGWNTAADGSGTNYYPVPTTFFMPSKNVTLYAVWNKQVNGTTTINQPPIYTVTISGPTTLYYPRVGDLTPTFNFTATYNGDLDGSTYAWYLDTSTTPIGTGSLSTASPNPTLSIITPTVSTYTYGGHLLMLVVMDTNGLSYAASVAITVEN